RSGIPTPDTHVHVSWLCLEGPGRDTAFHRITRECDRRSISTPFDCLPYPSVRARQSLLRVPFVILLMPMSSSFPESSSSTAAVFSGHEAWHRLYDQASR